MTSFSNASYSNAGTSKVSFSNAPTSNSGTTASYGGYGTKVSSNATVTKSSYGNYGTGTTSGTKTTSISGGKPSMPSYSNYSKPTLTRN